MKTLAEMIMNATSHTCGMKPTDNPNGITYFVQGQEHRLNYAQFINKALCHLRYLRLNGANEHSEVVIQIKNDMTFLTALWACILGGMKVVLLPLASNPQIFSMNQAIIAAFNKPFICISSEEYAKEDFCKQYGFTPQSVIDIKNSYENNNADDVIPYDAKPDDVAVIQFSSGSTSIPKGICTTHKNIIETAASFKERMNYTSQDSVFSWLPINHNMALLGIHMAAIHECGEQYLMSIYEFMSNPLKWMQYISDKRISITASPNFGLKYFLSFYEKYAHTCDWDLSPLRVIINGAEPISYELCVFFTSMLIRHNIPDNVILAGYGMSEATVGICLAQSETELNKISINRSKMSIGDEIEVNDDQAGATFVSVGKPLTCNELRITDNDGVVLEPGFLGNIEIFGNNVMQSYYNNPKMTEEAFTQDGWLKTGDIGMVIDGLVYITGRSKDIIFIAGKNYFPDDFEKIIEDKFPMLKTKIAICGVFNNEKETEQIALFIENEDGVFDQNLVNGIRRFFSSITQLQIEHVKFVDNLPRTPNGKIQRYRLLGMFN